MSDDDHDRRVLACCAAILLVPILLAAAQVAVRQIVEHWVVVPAIAAALNPLAFLNALLAGVAAAWTTILLPGGRMAFTIVAAVSAFIVGAAIYAFGLIAVSILAEMF